MEGGQVSGSTLRVSGLGGRTWAFWQVGDAGGASDAHAFEVVRLYLDEAVELVEKLEGVEPHVKAVVPGGEKHDLRGFRSGLEGVRFRWWWGEVRGIGRGVEGVRFREGWGAGGVSVWDVGCGVQGM